MPLRRLLRATPVIFYGQGTRAGRYAERALVGDAVPTLARLLGATPLERTLGGASR